jgi:hypothetical protein
MRTSKAYAGNVLMPACCSLRCRWIWGRDRGAKVTVPRPTYSASGHARTAITALSFAQIQSLFLGTNLAVCAFPTQQDWEVFVKIRAGYDIAFQSPYAVPMVLMLTTHPSRDGDILSDQSMQFSPAVEARDYFDPYGNICTRLVAPPGLLEVRSECRRG